MKHDKPYVSGIILTTIGCIIAIANIFLPWSMRFYMDQDTLGLKKYLDMMVNPPRLPS
jgi:hypothetical protein